MSEELFLTTRQIQEWADGMEARVSSIEKQLTRTKQLMALQARSDLMVEEIGKIEAAVLDIEKFLEKFSKEVHLRLDELEKPWWKRVMERCRRRARPGIGPARK